MTKCDSKKQKTKKKSPHVSFTRCNFEHQIYPDMICALSHFSNIHKWNIILKITSDRNMSLAARLAQTSRIAVRAVRNPTPVAVISTIPCRRNLCFHANVYVSMNKPASPELTHPFTPSHRLWTWTVSDDSPKYPRVTRKALAKRAWYAYRVYVTLFS